MSLFLRTAQASCLTQHYLGIQIIYQNNRTYREFLTTSAKFGIPGTFDMLFHFRSFLEQSIILLESLEFHGTRS